MTALTEDRDTPMREGELFEYPVAAATEIFAGSLVVLDASGNAEPATDAASKVAVGRCEEHVDNSLGAAADLDVKVRAGTFRWANSGTNTPTKANIGDMLYIVDDQTVDTLATSSSPAGVMVDIDSDGSWVKTTPPETLVSGLTAANNLSDVGTAATAATNLGLGTSDDVEFASVTIGEAILKTVNVTLTAAEIKALATTEQEIVAAVADKMLVPVSYALKFTYGSEVLAEPSAPDELRFMYVDSSGTALSAELDATAILIQTNDTYSNGAFSAVAGGTLAEAVNVAIVLVNTGTDYTGNASNDCSLEVTVTYLEVDVS